MENYEIKMPAMAAPFAMVYGPVIVDREVSDRALRLYSLLWALGDRFKEGWHSQALLSDLLHISPSTVKRGMRELSNAGLIAATARQPRPTLIRIEDPVSIYGEQMVHFYDYVKERSAALRQEGSSQKAKAPNGVKYDPIMGSNMTHKVYKGSRESIADSRPRDLEDTFSKLTERKTRQGSKRINKATPTRGKKSQGVIDSTDPLPSSSSSWGGSKFYLHCVKIAREYNVPIRDPSVHRSLVAPRYASEMGEVVKVFHDRGYDKDLLHDLFTRIFKHWSDFDRCFKKKGFSVYDLRYSINMICEIDARLRHRAPLEDMDDIEKPKTRSRRKGQVVYFDKEK